MSTHKQLVLHLNSATQSEPSAQTKVQLSRELRVCLVDEPNAYQEIAKNSWSGWPARFAFVPFVNIRITVDGPLDPTTHFLCNVKDLDRVLRESLKTLAEERLQTHEKISQLSPPSLLSHIWRIVDPEIPAPCSLAKLELKPTQLLKIWIMRHNQQMLSITQQFEFSAAHRLHNPELSESENKELFGKCNNPNGHGHNYLVEITVEKVNEDPHGDDGQFVLAEFQSIVKRAVIDRFDHKHLDVDLDDFKNCRSTVENIAKRVWELLDIEFNDVLKLQNVRIYETPKTWADYSRVT